MKKIITLMLLFFVLPMVTGVSCGDTIVTSTNLDQDLHCTSGNAIEINGQNVVFDCNGYIINGTGSIGELIIMSGNDNVTIRNCIIYQNGDYSIYIDNDAWYLNITNITIYGDGMSIDHVYDSDFSNIKHYDGDTDFETTFLLSDDIRFSDIEYSDWYWTFSRMNGVNINGIKAYNITGDGNAGINFLNMNNVNVTGVYLDNVSICATFAGGLTQIREFDLIGGTCNPSDSSTYSWYSENTDNVVNLLVQNVYMWTNYTDFTCNVLVNKNMSMEEGSYAFVDGQYCDLFGGQGGSLSPGSAPIEPISHVLEEWNPSGYAKLIQDWDKLVDGGTLNEFFKNILDLIVSFIKYVLREPASLVPEGGLDV